jgi:hypothetical protein
MEVDEL